MKKKKNQSGNVLFLILIAVALFAALSYAVTQSSRGGGNSDEENSKLYASEVMQYAASVKTAIMQMKLRGVGDEDFCFASNQWEAGTEQNNYNFHAACSDSENQIFHSDGGGVAWKAPNQSYMQNITSGIGSFTRTRWVFTGELGISGVGTVSTDLVMFLGPITIELCREINGALGLNDTVIPWDFIGASMWASSNRFFGQANTFYDPAPIGSVEIGDQSAELYGMDAGCGLDSVTGAPNNLYYFYYVLLAK